MRPKNTYYQNYNMFNNKIKSIPIHPKGLTQ